MEKEPFDPFEFAEDKVDKEFRKGFVMDTDMPKPVKEAPKLVKEAPKPKVQKPRKARARKVR